MEETAKKEKPKQILELEKLLKIEITEVEYKSFQYINSDLSSFSQNTGGNIISIMVDTINPDNVNVFRQFLYLKQLKISNSGIERIDWISDLIELEELIFEGNRISDISALAALKHLNIAHLGENKISDISPISDLAALTDLKLWENNISDIHPLSGLIALTELYLFRNTISDISPLSSLVNLKELWLEGNHIQDINPLKSLINLTALGISENKISDIHPLTFLAKLESIFCEYNQITTIPASLFENNPTLRINNIKYSTEHNYIYITDNPLTSPPYSVIDVGHEAVLAYFENKEKYGVKPLNEGRIILVGEGSAGKTTLVNRILGKGFNEGENQTNGINIAEWHLNKDGRDLRFNMWDFGGQEIQHAVHKFFFSSGCLYILVLDNRKEEEPEYWLQQVETLGGNAPVLVVFNKYDQHLQESVDRKFLKEKYPNIVGFYNVSCKTGYGLHDFIAELENQAPLLRTVNDQFPGNWFDIKKDLGAMTADDRHYLVYDAYVELCKKHGIPDEATQRILLKYFSSIGAVTWFEEDNAHLGHMHVLNPAWISQGVYRIVTGNLTQTLKGQINISDFRVLLQPTKVGDYEYNESHYGYILGLMKKFEICYAPNDREILIPASFSKEPKVEYSEFRGENVRTYILQFIDYLPVALIHRFIVRNIKSAYENNYWYTGAVLKDSVGPTLAMVHLDKEARRIYVRIKGSPQLGMWEHIRREFAEIASTYARIRYNELVAVDENIENNVNYADLISHIKAQKSIYFHPRLRKDFNVGYLMGFFESKEHTLAKFETGKISIDDANRTREKSDKLPPFVINILNNNSPTVQTNVQTTINIDIDINLVHQKGSELKGDAGYLIESLADTQVELVKVLKEVVQFAEDARTAQNSGDVKSKGWGRKLASVVRALVKGGEGIKNLSDGNDVLHSILHNMAGLAHQFNIPGISDLIK